MTELRWVSLQLPTPLTARVSVFADDPAVHVGRRDAQLLADQEMEARRVQVRTAPQHAVMGETADLPRNVRQNVHCRKAA